ncbi:hemolysin XhlA family protein, partial [Eubacterium sp.]|uniref:hemolysin XhlA family protein n=1 Tax=Eubacterium sp. TaxID=142586 RepID=UPI002FC8EAF9
EEKLEHIVDTHEKRINDHGERLDKLELQSGRLEERITALCDKLDVQTKAINWLIGLGATALVGFFMFVIQNSIF